MGSGFYSISDITGGLYAALGPFNVNQPGTFNDVCNDITITDASAAQFSIVDGTAGGIGAGTWDPITETLTIAWFDSGNGFGDVTVLTKN